MTQINPNSDPPPRTRVPSQTRPRRVVGGVRLSGDLNFAESVIAQRWMAVLTGAAPSDVLTEGLEYARLGQTKRLDIAVGVVTGLVQGRTNSPYETSLRFPVLTPAQWQQAEGALAEQPAHTARLLTGTITPELDSLLRAADVEMVPMGVEPRCTCSAKAGTWCLHASCLGYLLVQRLSREPTTVFLLRGMTPGEFLERVRHRRRTAGMLDSDAPVYVPHVQGLSDAPADPLDAHVGDFWTGQTDPADLDFAPSPPELTHPLLRRLGASPFERGKFPLVGLLVTCYEVISESALKSAPADGGDAKPEEP